MSFRLLISVSWTLFVFELPEIYHSVICYSWNNLRQFCPPRNSCIETLTPNVTVWRREVYEDNKVEWSHEVKPWSSRTVTVALSWEEETPDSPFSLSPSPCPPLPPAQRKSPGRHNEKAAVCRPAARTRQKPTLTAHWPWTSSLQNCKKIHSCCLSHRVCGLLSWRPKLTNSLPQRIL